MTKEAFKNAATKEFWSNESYQKGDPHLANGEYWSTPIREHMMKVLIDSRTQKAGEKLSNKPQPFGRKEKFYISIVFLHGKNPLHPGIELSSIS